MRMLQFMPWVIIALVAGVLGGCNITTGQIDTTTDKVAQAFQSVCLALPTAHQNFLAIAAAFNVKQSVIDKETQVYNSAVAICASGVVDDLAGAVKTLNDKLNQINQQSAAAS